MNLLIRLIPPPLVRFFARPYVAGDSIEQALKVAARLAAKDRQLSTLDLLAEGIDSQEMVDQNAQTYIDLIDQIAADARFGVDQRPTVSLKYSSYTTAPMEEGGDAAGAAEVVRRIVEHAKERGVAVTIDMESRHWTDYTLDQLDALHRAGHDHVGCVIQTRLLRSEADLERLPQGCRVRLVIGIYREPESVALTHKPEMKERMLTFARRLLEAGHFVEFATHDERYVKRFLEEVVAELGVGTDRFEVQMLYGVPRAKLLGRLVESGVTVRLYVPFAIGWGMAIAYLRRRLDEYPAMAFLVLKNWLRFG